MTVKLAPDSPKLTMNGKPDDNPDLSDSTWEGLDDQSPEEATQQNLGRIARSKRNADNSSG